MRPSRYIGIVAAMLLFVGQAVGQSALDQEINSLGLNVETPEVDETQADSNTGQTPNSNESVAVLGDEIRVLLKPRRTTLIAAEASGQVRSFPFNIGDIFKKGDILMKVKCGKIYAQIEAAKARLNTSKVQFESNQSLLAQGGGSKFDVEISRARMIEAEATLKSEQVSSSGCSMRAPYSGKVVSVLIERFEYVTQGQQVLEIIDDSRLNMQLYVPSSWVTKLRKNDVFTVQIDEVGKAYEAEVLRINPRVDAGSKTLEIIAGLTKQHKELRAGMSGNAKFKL